jgi:hypothetical protein
MLFKPVSADQEFIPAIYKNRDPISVCAKLRVEEGGSIVGRVQSKEANPQFFFTLALNGSGAPVRSTSPLAKTAKQKMQIDLAKRMRESSAMRK